jgi:hypothetical protein
METKNRLKQKLEDKL